MLDGNRRTINYLRISVTDRCNLRCVYCMPEEGIRWIPHEEILSYEEILRLCRIFAGLGVTRFKLTGGEPLVRKGLDQLIGEIKAIDGVSSVTLTTNGVLLKEQLPALKQAGLDGVNISLDTLDRKQYEKLTRRDELEQVLESLKAALSEPDLNVKVNCVLSEANREEWAKLAGMAKDQPLSVRFIELMPLGLGKGLPSCTEDAVRQILIQEYGTMEAYAGKLGNGPCRYYTLPGFQGTIGFISAMSHQFCSSCNRIRLTAGGFLKTCLQYKEGIELRPLLKEEDRVLEQAIREAVFRKPAAHQFQNGGIGGEERMMSQIGG